MAPTPPAESPVSSTCVASARSCCRKRSCITAAAMRLPRNCQPARSESSPAPALQIICAGHSGMTALQQWSIYGHLNAWYAWSYLVGALITDVKACKHGINKKISKGYTTNGYDHSGAMVHRRESTQQYESAQDLRALFLRQVAWLRT